MMRCFCKVNGKEVSVRFELKRLQENLKSLAKQRGVPDRTADYEAELLRVYFYEKYTDYKDEPQNKYTEAEAPDPLHDGLRGETSLRFFQEGIQKEVDKRTKGRNIPDEVAIQQVKSLMNTIWRHEAEHIL
jgi:hypothetical protein